MRIEMKDRGAWAVYEIPISAEELKTSRENFKVWVRSKPTGPLDGSWGALMDWWMNDQKPEWRKFDTIDRCYLKYAVGLPSRRIRHP